MPAANTHAVAASAAPLAAAAGGLRLQLLGPPLLLRDGVPAQALSPRLAALLALIVLGGPLRRSQAAELFYPQLDAAGARRNLRQLLFGQRALLDELLDGRDELLSLRAEVAVDLLQAGDATGSSPPLLGGLNFDDMPAFAHWLEAQRSRLCHGQQDELARRASAEEAAGRLAGAILLAQQLIELDPGSEHAHRRLMRLHYLRGDRAAALAAFDQCERLLKQELSTRPSAETLNLLQQIEQSATPPAAPLRPVPAPVLRPPRLIGRSEEWKTLLQAWAQAEGLLLLGEAGMGKSRLLGDLALVRPGCLVVAARPGDEPLPYALLTRLLRALIATHRLQPAPGLRNELARVLPELGDTQPLADLQDRARFVSAVQALLTEAMAAGLAGLALDDLHFADAASLALLPGLLSAPGLPWAAAARPAELPDAAQGLRDLAPTPLRLGPLNEAAVAALLASLALPELAGADTALLYRQSGGNPLYLLEILKSWLNPGMPQGLVPGKAPPRVGELIMQRINRLSATAVQLARCAAVAGQDFSAALAASVMGQRLIELSDPWAELEAAQVLRDGVFAHDLIHEAALASVPPAVARGLHAEIAAFLTQTGQTPAVRLAAHWRAAGEWARAGEAYRQAAEQARTALRRLDEAELLRQSAACAQAAGDGRAEFESRLALAEAALCESLAPDVLDLAQQALRLAASEDEQLRALAVLAHAMAQRVDEFGPHRLACEQGIALARRLDRPDLVMRLALSLAQGLLNARAIGATLALLEPLRDWAEQSATPAQLCEFYNWLGMALDYANQLAEAVQVHERQCELARRHGLHEATALALYSLGSSLAKRGRLRQAVQAMDSGLQLTRSRQALGGQVLHRQATLGWRRRDLGELNRALDLMEGALTGLESAGPGAAAAFSVSHRLALAHAQLGQHARARRLLQGHEPAEGELPARRGLWLSHSAELYRLAGEPGPAREQAVRALALLEAEREDTPYRVVCLQACLLLEPVAGEAMAAGLAAWAAAHERFGLALAAHVRGADCAVRAGAADRALGHAEAAIGLANRFDSELIYKGEYWLGCGQALALAGRRAEAQAMREAGRQWLTQCAAERVPQAFVDSFLERNPVNLALRQFAA